MKNHLANVHETLDTQRQRYVLTHCGTYMWSPFVTKKNSEVTCKNCLKTKPQLSISQINKLFVINSTDREKWDWFIELMKYK